MWEEMLDLRLFLSRLRPGLGLMQLWTRQGIRAEFLASLPLPMYFWFSLNVPITQAFSGHRDRNKSHKPSQPEAGNPILPQRPEEAPVQSMPDHSGPHTPHGHEYAPLKHMHNLTFISPTRWLHTCTCIGIHAHASIQICLTQKYPRHVRMWVLCMHVCTCARTPQKANI